MIITKQGQIIRIDSSEIRQAGRSTQGVRLVRMEDDDQVAAAMRAIFDDTHNVAEGAGAAAVAAILQERDGLRGKRVAAVLSGGNVDRAMLAEVLNG